MKLLSAMMPLKKIATVFIIISCFPVGYVTGGDQDKLRYALLLIEKTEMSKTFISLAEVSLEPYFERFEGQNKESQIAINALRNIFVEEVNLAEEELKWELAEIYARDFTEEELRGIVSFFDSPIGKAWLERGPIVNTEFDQIGHEWSQFVVRRTRQKFEAAYEGKF